MCLDCQEPPTPTQVCVFSFLSDTGVLRVLNRVLGGPRGDRNAIIL